MFLVILYNSIKYIILKKKYHFYKLSKLLLDELYIPKTTDNLSQVFGRTKLHKKVSRNIFFY